MSDRESELGPAPGSYRCVWGTLWPSLAQIYSHHHHHLNLFIRLLFLVSLHLSFAIFVLHVCCYLLLSLSLYLSLLCIYIQYLCLPLYLSIYLSLYLSFYPSISLHLSLPRSVSTFQTFLNFSLSLFSFLTSTQCVFPPLNPLYFSFLSGFFSSPFQFLFHFSIPIPVILTSSISLRLCSSY